MITSLPHTTVPTPPSPLLPTQIVTPPRVKVVDGHLEPVLSDSLDAEGWNEAMMTVLGCDHMDTVALELDDIRTALELAGDAQRMELTLNRYLEVLASVQPRDAVERSLVKLTFISERHAISMMGKKGSCAIQPATRGTLAMKYMSAAARLTDAFRHYRYHGQQTIQVVAQNAIVGNVTTKG